MVGCCLGEVDEYDIGAGERVLHGRPRDDGVDAVVRLGAEYRIVGDLNRPPWTQRLSEQLRVFGMTPKHETTDSDKAWSRRPERLSSVITDNDGECLLRRGGFSLEKEPSSSDSPPYDDIRVFELEETCDHVRRGRPRQTSSGS